MGRHNAPFRHWRTYLGCVIDFRGSWDDNLPLIEFSYNNTYHSYIGIAPFEAQYCRRCRSPFRWFEVGDSSIFYLEIIHQALEKVRVIRDCLQSAKVLYR